MKTPGIVNGLLFNESRKFGAGLWIILLSTTVYFFGREPHMTISDWKDFIFAAGLLIGGGTLADTYLGKKRLPDAPPAPPPAA